MICASCMSRIERAYDARERILQNEKSCFQPLRELNQQPAIRCNTRVNQLASKSKTKQAQKAASVAKPEQVQCQVCLRNFANKGNWKTHFSMVHKKETRFQCDLCPKTFYLMLQVRSHMKWHMNPKNNRCGASGWDTTDTSRPFRCNFPNCSKRYKVKFDWKAHQRTHSGKDLIEFETIRKHKII